MFVSVTDWPGGSPETKKSIPHYSCDYKLFQIGQDTWHEFIENLVHGYKTLAGEGSTYLSGGEQQRMGLARAIPKDAPIILLDEATASLDPENEL